MKFINQIISISFALTMVLGFSSCSENHFHEGKVLGGKYIEAEELNLGKQIYSEYCMACHGVKGDGKGVAAKGLVPPPRDFTKGLFKFGWVVSGERPTDKSLHKLIRHGLNGTAMLPWDMSHDQVQAVIQYIKTFAPEVWEGKDKTPAKMVSAGKDPFGLARKAFAIEKGKEVYHVTAQCQSCHRAYVSKAELSSITYKLEGNYLNKGDFDPEMYKLKIQETEWGFKNIPPDFTWHEVRSASSVSEIAQRLAAGVGGTTMPAWKETITDEEIWAVAYYVRSLMDLKNTPERIEFINSLEK